MKISGTIDELLMVVRSCEGIRMMGECQSCPLVALIDGNDEECDGIETICGIGVIDGDQEDR